MHQQPVLWSEGLCLQPAHFQQLERSLLHQVQQWLQARGGPPAWGFACLEFDEAALAHGVVALRAARGVLADGTPFDVPGLDPAPPPWAGEAGDAGVELDLVLPLAASGRPGSTFDAAEGGAWCRRSGWVVAVPDTLAADAPPVEMALGRLSLRLLPRQAAAEPGLVRLPVARMLERQADGRVQLDPGFMPPLLDARACPALQAWVDEVSRLLARRADLLAARLSRGEAGDLAADAVASAHAGARPEPEPEAEPDAWGDAVEPAELLQLQAVQVAAARWLRLQARQPLHPQALHAALADTVAALAAVNPRRAGRVRPAPPYLHDRPRDSLEPLMIDLRDLLHEALHPSVLPLPLLPQAPGLWRASLVEPSWLAQARLVLAVRGDAPDDWLRLRVVQQVKVGPPDRLRELVRLHLPALGLVPLAGPPPRLPAWSGAVFFELDTGGPLMSELLDARALAVHLAGHLPGLRLSLWALRRSAAGAAGGGR